jgi:hypothetical protein
MVEKKWNRRNDTKRKRLAKSKQKRRLTDPAETWPVPGIVSVRAYTAVEGSVGGDYVGGVVRRFCR